MTKMAQNVSQMIHPTKRSTRTSATGRKSRRLPKPRACGLHRITHAVKISSNPRQSHWMSSPVRHRHGSHTPASRRAFPWKTGLWAASWAGQCRSAIDVPELPLSTLATVNRDFATGGAEWDTAGAPGETQSYRGTWRFDTTGMSQDQVNAMQGAVVSIDLVWELQSNDSPVIP